MSRATASPGSRRKTVGLIDRDMNRYDDNLTLPVTKGDRKHKRGVSIGGSFDSLSETQLLRRQAVSEHGTETLTAQRPRKSILKTAPDEASRIEELEQAGQIVDYGATIDFGQLRQFDAAPRASMPSQASSRTSLGSRRRVSFAPAAHVR